jgi:hypothetical protein
MLINLDQTQREPVINRRSKLLFLAYSVFGLGVEVVL